MSTTTLPKVTLYSTVGGADKVYCIEIAASGTGFIVNFANGRRGGTLATGTKTTSPVSIEAAQKIYDKVYKEKTGKGYTEGEGARAFSGTDLAGRVSGLLPQLLNFVERTEMESLVLNPNFMFQEKKDGNRIMIRKTGDKVEAVNRKGLTVGFPEEVHHEGAALAGDFILDGEMIDQVFYAFDCLASPMEGDIRKKTTKQRYEALVALISVLDGVSNLGLTNIQLVHAAFTTAEKRALFDRLEKEGQEGIVAKEVNASYEVGRPGKGGNQLKFKFYETATVLVASVNNQRSVRMEVVDESGKKTVEIGNVTIPPNKKIPNAGDYIEVRYLYAYRGGSLFQPTFLNVRNDMEYKDCNIAQLKFKA